MRLEALFEKFDLFADIPNAVEKMRELILQLAVRGRLVPQLVGDGDAEELLGAIGVARAKRGGARSPVAAERDGASDVMARYEIPATWRWVRLATLGEIVG